MGADKVYFSELCRYAVVGAISFLFDFAILMLAHNALGYVTGSLYLATALGFLGGIMLNTYLSVKYVFVDKEGGKYKQRLVIHDYIKIIIIGITGLGLTELGMYIGVDFIGIYYLWSKIVVTAIVFLWNYWARKVFVF
jgi:putative flippase GtrA